MQYLTEKILPAYPFVQYRDDPNVVAFFEAYNEIAQEYLDSLNNLALPCWTSESITGQLLDWIALGIYGVERPLLQVSEEAIARGAYAVSYTHLGSLGSTPWYYESAKKCQR